MNTQDKKTAKTVQQLHAELVDKLNGKVNGLTVEIMSEMSAQDLQTILDSLAMVTKVDNGKTRSNIATTILAHCLKEGITELSEKQLFDLVKRENLRNYFNLPADYDTNKTIELINIDILLNRIKSNSDKADNAKRQSQWFARAKAYTDSHLIGTSNDGSMFNSENVTHYFVKENNVYKLVEKQIEPETKN